MHILKFRLPCSTNLFYYQQRFGEAGATDRCNLFGSSRGTRKGEFYPTTYFYDPTMSKRIPCDPFGKKKKGIILRTNDFFV